MSSAGSPGRLASLGKGARWLAGIVIVSLVGALTTVIVGSLSPPDEISAKLSDVSIDRNVTLGEYAIRSSDRHASLQGGGESTMLLVAHIAQTPARPEGGASPGDTTSGGDETSAGDEREGGDETPPPGDEKQDDGQTEPADDETRRGGDARRGGETSTPDGGGETPGTTDETTTGREAGDTGAVVRPQLDPELRDRLDAGLRDALQAPGVPRLAPARACIEDTVTRACGLTSIQTHLTDGDGSKQDVSTAAIGRRLARIFRGTRTRRALSDSSRRDLVGVTVNFDIALTGFRRGAVDVKWSLYSARDRVRVPPDWLRNQRVLELRGEATRDSASGEFWVPIPQLKGPFFIRVGVFDDDGTRLDYADTARFR
jgi:hypothetical protein